MNGKLNPIIAQSFEVSFENNCLILFGEAYLFIKGNAGITVDWDEENISANFFDYIDNAEKAIAWNINVSDEYRLYDAAVIKGRKAAKGAYRIDFRLTTNYEKRRIEYFVEAKNLIETDCLKASRATKINARALQERYVETGIDKYCTGKYPTRGCLIGYVLQGDPKKIVEKMNLILEKRNRNAEQLQVIDSTIPGLDYCYQSLHNNRIKLKHFLLPFSA